MLDLSTTLNANLSTLRQNAHTRLGSHQSNSQVFAGMLGKVQRAGNTKDPEKIREVAEKYVAGALVLPLLKQAREARDATPPFGMTEAEKQMGSLMDSHLATDMVKRGNWGIVDNITRKLVKAAGISAAAHASPTPSTDSTTLTPAPPSVTSTTGSAL